MRARNEAIPSSLVCSRAERRPDLDIHNLDREERH
jgi:hypothetical protein